MKKGFTMIEILISIAIIAVLTAIGIVSYVSINKNARDAKRRGDIEQIRSALELYRSDNGYYPAPAGSPDPNGVDVDDLGVDLVDTYLPGIPSDPKGDVSPYKYQATNLSVTTGHYYGYCLSAMTEGVSGSSCTPSSGYTYGTKNP